VKATFKYAPAKLKALGLIGGGVSALPAGYLAAEFLESTGTQYIDTEIKGSFSHVVEFKASALTNVNAGCCGWIDTRENPVYARYHWSPAAKNNVEYNIGIWCQYDNKDYPSGYYKGWEVGKNYKIKIEPQQKNIILNNKKIDFTTDAPPANYSTDATICIFGRLNQDKTLQTRPSRFFFMKVTDAGVKILDVRATIDANGVPCMFDKVGKQPFYNSGTGAFIVGMTLEQARKLGKLPAGGGTLKVSLPSNYLENEGVVNAIAEANAKGWNIEVASTWDASAASATFALRRIWVRKTQAEQGNYVAADGTRWAVESCVAMYNADGSEPDAHGYEPFRSVDAAVAYWELVPYVYPDEELLTVQ
jgi:hypothetical protein